MTVRSINPILYGYGERGQIIIPDGAPFDGNPVLIKLATGWCEAWWDNGRQINTVDGPETEGFCWVCMDDEFQAELDDVKSWTSLPEDL